MVRVLVVDDHAIVREGLKRILAEVDGVEVVADVGTVEAALQCARVEALDVVLLDLSLPDRSGLEALKQLKLLRPALKVLILTMHEEDQYAVRMLKAGADGYLTKGRPSDEVIHAIQRVSEGGRFITPRLAELLLEPGLRDGEAPHARLTDREHDILLMLGRGQAPSLVAAALDIRPSTVSTHIHRIKSKLGLDSVGKLIQYAVRAGLVE